MRGTFFSPSNRFVICWSPLLVNNFQLENEVPWHTCWYCCSCFHDIQKVTAQPSSSVQYQSNSVALLSRSALTIFLFDCLIMRPIILSATMNSSSVHFAWAICRVQNLSPSASCEATGVVFCAAIAIEASMSSSELLVGKADGGRRDVGMDVMGWIWLSSGRVERPGFCRASYASSKRSFIGCSSVQAISHSSLTLIAEGRRTRNAVARRMISMGRPSKLLRMRPSNTSMKGEDAVDLITSLGRREMRYFDDATCHRNQPCC